MDDECTSIYSLKIANSLLGCLGFWAKYAGEVKGTVSVHVQEYFFHIVIDFFCLYILFSQYRSCDDTQEI